MSEALRETSGGCAVPRRNVNIETPIGLRRLTERGGDRDISGFAPERTSLRRIFEVKELRSMKELIAEVWEKQDLLQSEYLVLKQDLMDSRKDVSDLKKEIKNLKTENESLKKTVNTQEGKIKDVREQIKDIPTKAQTNLEKIQELKNDWKKEQENQQVSFREIVNQQVKEKTRETVVQVIKEKHNLVREAVDKKKCVVVFGVIEKRNPVKFVRDREV